MTEPILKILYEFWIIDSYDSTKVDSSRVFSNNKNNHYIKEKETLSKNDIIVYVKYQENGLII